MHPLKTKRELEIFEQGVQKGREEMKEKCLSIIDKEYLGWIPQTEKLYESIKSL